MVAAAAEIGVVEGGISSGLLVKAGAVVEKPAWIASCLPTQAAKKIRLISPSNDPSCLPCCFRCWKFIILWRDISDTSSGYSPSPRMNASVISSAIESLNCLGGVFMK